MRTVRERGRREGVVCTKSGREVYASAVVVDLAVGSADTQSVSLVPMNAAAWRTGSHRVKALSLSPPLPVSDRDGWGRGGGVEERAGGQLWRT